MAHSGGKESGLSRSITQGGEVAHISLLITEERQAKRGGERDRRDSIATGNMEGTDRWGERVVKVKQGQVRVWVFNV